MPKPMRDQLALVGLSHLVAVSGYNLTIMVAAAHRLLERFGRGVALAASLWLIGGFLLVTGASASIVRASCVSVLALVAAFYGRRFAPLALIFFVAGVTAAWYPGYLTDLGWLLSFIAFFGIMVVAPAVMSRLGNPKWLAVQLFVESSVAHILTVPLIMYVFGNLSVIAPLSNLLVLPMVPLAMLTTFIAGLAGMVLPALAGWFAWPGGLVLGFMLGLIGWFAHVPWAGVTAQIGWVVMLLGYGAMVVVTLALKQVNQRLGRTEQDPASDPLARRVSEYSRLA
jgi:competence protein ComEC